MAVGWDPALVLGHAEIDRQHEEMFRRFAALVAAMEVGAPREVELLFDFLGEYVAGHFAAEERVMAATRYPGATVHAAAHARFVREYRELKALYDENGATHGVAVKTKIWIGDWLRTHIIGVDRALAHHLDAR